jgi:hypothetical protein
MKLNHTLENCLKAKQLLIENTCLTESDFIYADSWDTELGYIEGEPLLTSEDDCNSALNMWNDKLFWDEHEEDYINFMINEDIKRTTE